jgi:hypothetical protein
MEELLAAHDQIMRANSAMTQRQTTDDDGIKAAEVVLTSAARSRPNIV